MLIRSANCHLVAAVLRTNASRRLASLCKYLWAPAPWLVPSLSKARYSAGEATESQSHGYVIGAAARSI